MKSICKTLVFLAATSILPGISQAATIDFNTLSGSNGDNFTTYTENGYTVTTTSGSYQKAISAPGFIGDPVPSIYTFGGTVTITKVGGGDFDFTSVDLANYGGVKADYTITGLLGSTVEFTASGKVSGPAQTFNTYGTGNSADLISSLTISLSDSETANVDNVVVNAPVAATPEPSSLMLLGTGVLSAAGLMRRRLSA